MTTTTRLDERLTATVSTDTLVQIWANHTPAHLPAPATCEGCGHRYSLAAPLCPTAAIVRPVLWRRRHEYGTDRLSAALTFNQWRDLSDPIEKLSTYTRSLIIRIGTAPAVPDRETAACDDLFDTGPYQRWGGRR